MKLEVSFLYLMDFFQQGCYLELIFFKFLVTILSKKSSFVLVIQGTDPISLSKKIADYKKKKKNFVYILFYFMG